MKTCFRHSGVGAHQRQERREEGKMEEREESRHRGRKPRTPTPAIHALIGGEEQTGKRERNGKRVSNPATLDSSVASYDPQGSYGKSILVKPPAYRDVGVKL